MVDCYIDFFNQLSLSGEIIDVISLWKCLYVLMFEALVSDNEDGDDDDGGKERHCDSLIMCIITTLNEGLRNGGGIGDVLRKPSNTVTS